MIAVEHHTIQAALFYLMLISTTIETFPFENRSLFAGQADKAQVEFSLAGKNDKLWIIRGLSWEWRTQIDVGDRGYVLLKD